VYLDAHNHTKEKKLARQWHSPEKLLYERSRDDTSGGMGPERLLIDRSRLTRLVQYSRPWGNRPSSPRLFRFSERTLSSSEFQHSTPVKSHMDLLTSCWKAETKGGTWCLRPSRTLAQTCEGIPKTFFCLLLFFKKLLLQWRNSVPTYYSTLEAQSYLHI
jgi:hypothetical protein